METISFDDFKKLDIRIGKILAAEKVEGSDKLLKLEVDFGSASAEASAGEGRITRQIIAGIGKVYEAESLIGKECPFAYNLETKILKGLESQGMILCTSNEGSPVLLHPDKEILAGSDVK